jgi:hypothetical protein
MVSIARRVDPIGCGLTLAIGSLRDNPKAETKQPFLLSLRAEGEAIFFKYSLR